jgi:hypothetical protein
MSETKQLTSEELQQIQEMQTQYNKFVFELGNIEAQLQALLQQKVVIESEKDGIVSDLKTLSEQERVMVRDLQEKYGIGNINPQTGEITPF